MDLSIFADKHGETRVKRDDVLKSLKELREHNELDSHQHDYLEGVMTELARRHSDNTISGKDLREEFSRLEHGTSDHGIDSSKISNHIAPKLLTHFEHH